jgi:hypothetical protein
VELRKYIISFSLHNISLLVISNLASKPLGSLVDLRPTITQMAGIDIQSTTANAIVGVAPDPALVGRKVGDVAAVLLVSGVSKECHAHHLSLETGFQFGNDVVHHSGTLRVSTGNDFGTARGLLEGGHAFVNAVLICSLWAAVCCQGRCVWYCERLHARDLASQS